jgi:hypothetical protein
LFSHVRARRKNSKCSTAQRYCCCCCCCCSVCVFTAVCVTCWHPSSSPRLDGFRYLYKHPHYYHNRQEGPVVLPPYKLVP